MNTIQIGKFKIDPILFEKGFAKGCGPFQCHTTCCSSGVFIDPAEKEAILQHKEEVKMKMDETQTQDETAWFENSIEEDSDFPSGYAVGTEVFNNKCVFLRKDGKCSVQLVSAEKYNDPWKIKPYFCVAFPISVDNSVVTFDDYQQGNAPCCSIVADTNIPLIESCKAELEYVLGKEGYQQLIGYSAVRNSQ